MLTLNQHNYLFSRIRLVPKPPDRGVRGHCWRWRGRHDGKGYGQWDPPAPRNGLSFWVHRAVYQGLVGRIPEGLELDHLCRVVDCCNPAHLEPVTHQENCRRGRSANREKTHCWQGHLLSGDNVWVAKTGMRHCRACSRERARRWKAQNPNHQREYRARKKREREEGA